MKSLAKFNLTQQLTHNLGTAIVKGEYNVLGSLPSEAELCSQFDVSRTATREAVKMLSAKGLISSRPKQGIRVQPETNWNMFDTDVLEWILNSKPSLALLKEFTQMRYAIEPEAAALAALNPTIESIVEMQKALIRMTNADKGLDDALESDIEFHTTILHASHNRFFTQLHEFTSTALRVSIRYTNRIKGVHGADVEKHRDVVKAIEAKDPVKARLAMQELLGEALALIDSELAKG